MADLKNILLDNKKLASQKLSLKLKITGLTCAAAFIFLAVLTSLVYMFGYNELKNIWVENNREAARILAASVSGVIDKQIDLVQNDANSSVLVDAAKAANAKYGAMGESEARRYLMDIDKRWIEAPGDHPLVREYLDSRTSVFLKELRKENDTIASLIATDKFGGFLGATYRPSGFYSLDKDWWTSANANGEGKSFAGGVEYDEAAKTWCLPIAVAIKGDSGSVAGIYRAAVDINLFFKPLQNFKVGRTGNAALVDDKAYLLYDRRTEPFANKFCEYKEMSDVLQNENKWGILSSAYAYSGKTLVAFSKVEHLSFNGHGNRWYIFVEQDLGEVMSPVNKLIFQMILIGIALLIILALIVFILSGQEIPNYSVLQVIKDSSAEKSEEKVSEEMKNQGRRLPHESEQPKRTETSETTDFQE